MKLHVRNYRGVESADIDLSGVALVVGPNGSGKTSIAEALKACLTGSPIVVKPEVEKIPQKSAQELVTDGQEKGYVMLKDGEDTEFTVNYPSCRTTGKGQPLHASEVACGSEDVSLPRLRPQFRAPALAELINAVPQLQDLVRFMKENEIELDPKQAKQIWGIIEEKEWDGAEKQARDRGIEIKGQYVETTGGARWTKDGAPDWRPEAYDPEWDSRNMEFFDTAIAAAQGHYDEVVGKGYVAATERAALEDGAAKLGENQVALKTYQDEATKAETTLAACQAQHQDTIPADIFWRLPCPHCGAEIAAVRPVSGGSLPELIQSQTIEDPGNAKETKERRMEIASVEGNLSHARGALVEINKIVAAAEIAVRDSETARDRLAGLGAPATATEEKARTAATAIVERAHRNKATFRSYRRSLTLDHTIRNNRVLCKALAPTGVRQKVMAAKLEPFNARVSDVSANMGIPPVVIDNELLITMGDRPYRLCSESEKFRVRIALQIAWALEDKSAAVVIDNDVDMDVGYYNNLIKALCFYKLPALVSIRIDRPERTPKLEQAPAGIAGVVYWMADGKAEEVSRKNAAEVGDG